MALLEKTIDLYLRELVINSQELFEEANNYKERGAFICYFDSITQLTCCKEGTAIVFIPEEKLSQIADDKKLMEFINHYNPDQQFVVYITVCISKSRSKAGLEDGCTRSLIIHRDAYKHVNDKEMKGSLIKAQDFDIEKFITNKNLTCISCGKSAIKMPKCGKCKSVTYCDRTCQIKDWSNHKTFCASFQQNINEMISKMN